MKKVFLGISAVGVAAAAVAFTTAPKKSTTTDYYFQQTVNGATVPISTSTAPPTTLPSGWNCSGGLIKCAADFTSYTLTAGLTKYTSVGNPVSTFTKSHS